MRKKIDIDLVGFDLDKTLYKPNPVIDDKITDYVCRKGSEFLKQDYDSVRNKYDELFIKTQSGKDSLSLMGVENAVDIIQEALEYSDIASILERDDRLVRTMHKLKNNFKLFLITGSGRKISTDKLSALGIDENIFFPRLYADSNYKRKDGSAFNYISNMCNVPFERMMFVGDREKADILPAKKLGMTTAIVNERSNQADYQLKEIYDLEHILLKN